jgi:L-ascorbate metabolism protein UlaG (beta-lactamase superfamily)
VKQPLLQDDAFLADVEAHAAGPALWWLGQSGWLIMLDGQGLLLDPYLSDSLTRKYASTDKPHVRITARVVDPGRLRHIVAVTSSHNHTDHLDAETLGPLRQANPALQLVLPEANRAFASERLQCPSAWPVGLRDNESVTVGPFRLTAVPAAHEHLGPEFMGLIVEFAGRRLYHPGDCVLFDGLVERIRPFEVDLALLPVNGSLPERRVAGNFWGREAAWLARETGARLAIPMHYDLFEFNTVTPDEFVEHCERLGQPYRVLRNGERLDVPRG